MPAGFVIGDRGLGASGDTHAAWMLGHAETGAYRVVGASAIGQIHLAHNRPRDDAFVVRGAGPWIAIAVSDGVGSRPLSRFGATYTADALSALLLRGLIPLPQADSSASTAPRRNAGVERDGPAADLDDVDFRSSVARRRHRRGGSLSLREGFRVWSRAVEGPPSEPQDAAPSPQEVDSEREPAPERLVARPAGGYQRTGSLCWSPIGESPGTELRDATPPPADAPSEDKVREAFRLTYLGLQEHAKSLNLNILDLGCTALGLLFNTETGHAIAAQIGDGAILGRTLKGQSRELVTPDDPNDGQSTYTLNQPNFDKHLVIRSTDPVEDDPVVTFYVMTDGISTDVLYTPQSVEEWEQKVDANLRSTPGAVQAAAGMLNWLATYEVTGSWDDRTLVVITRMDRPDADS